MNTNRNGNIDIDDDIIDIRLPDYWGNDPIDLNVIIEITPDGKEIVDMVVSHYRDNGMPHYIDHILEESDRQKIKGVIYHRFANGDYT